MTVTSVAVATKKFLAGMCDCTVYSDAGTGDFSLVLGILQVWGHGRVQSHVSPSMGYYPNDSYILTANIIPSNLKNIIQTEKNLKM